MPRLVDMPHSQDAVTNSRILAIKSRTAPKRWVRKPVSGTAIALATANEVMTQVPWLELTAKSPEIAGIDTLAIEVSSTFMKVANANAVLAKTSMPPLRGAGDPLGAGFAVASDGVRGGLAELDGVVISIMRVAQCVSACADIAPRLLEMIRLTSLSAA